MINRKSVKKDIFSTLKESIKEDFNIIPKSSEIKKKLHESSFPFSFEVPFVLEDDISEIMNMFNSNMVSNPEMRDSFSLSFKPNSNTLIVNSKTQEINDILIGLVNDYQIYGNPVQTGSVPLGAQEPKEEEGISAEISDIMDKSPVLCPVCTSIETVVMGENIYRCRECTHLFETKKYDEDKLIDPDKVDPDEKTDKILRKKEEKLDEEGAVGPSTSGVGTTGTTTADMAEIPTAFSKKQKREMKT